MKKIILLAVVSASFLFPRIASATVIWQEDFSYANGNLTNNSGNLWAVVNGGGNLPVQVNSGVAGLTNVLSGTSGEDLRRPLDAAYTSGLLYASILVTVANSPSTANGDYFASFYSSAGAGGGFGTRIFSSATAGGWTFGLTNAGTVPTDWGTDLIVGTQYKIVLRYDVTTRAATMGVFDASYTPVLDSELLISSPAGTVTGSIDNFALRQGAGVSMNENLDGIWIGTTLSDVAGIAVPEPSTIALAALGGFACLLALRRKR